MSALSRIFEFRGYLVDPSGQKELVVWIDAPQQTLGEADFHCQIGGSVLPRPMKVYGEDAEQAKDLAYSVVKQRLAGKTLLDATGTATQLPKLITS